MNIAQPQLALLLVDPFTDADQQAQDGGRQEFHMTKVQHQVDAGRLLHNRFHRLPQSAHVGILENPLIREGDNRGIFGIFDVDTRLNGSHNNFPNTIAQKSRIVRGPSGPVKPFCRPPALRRRTRLKEIISGIMPSDSQF
jgi:hypothetical protein